MRGLRTNEGAKFEKYFAIIEEEARGCREMAAIKEGGVTQNESLLPKFLHKKRWLTIPIFLRYML